MGFKHKQTIINSLESYLTSKGINTSNNFNCLIHNHVKKNTMHYYRDTNQLRCFHVNCRLNLDIFNLIGFEYGLNTFKEQYEKACYIFGLDDGYIKNELKMGVKQQIKAEKNNVVEMISYKEIDITKEILQAHKINPGYNYFCGERGLNKRVIDFYRLSMVNPLKIIPVDFLPKNKAGQVLKDIENYNIILPIWSNKKVVNCILRRNDKLTSNSIKTFNLSNVKLEIFNKNIIKKDVETIYICEGIFDCLSLESFEHDSIAINSVNMSSRLIKHLEKHIELISNKQFVLCGDNDIAGQKMNSDLMKFFDKNNIFATAFNLKNCKDINELLLNGGLS